MVQSINATTALPCTTCRVIEDGVRFSAANAPELQIVVDQPGHGPPPPPNVSHGADLSSPA